LYIYILIFLTLFYFTIIKILYKLYFYYETNIKYNNVLSFEQSSPDNNSLSTLSFDKFIVISPDNSSLSTCHSDKFIVYLFCYGSNSINQIKQRLNIDEDIEYFPSYINNYCRIFGGFSKKWSGGVASIYPLLSNKVYGITVKLTNKQLEELDNFEKGYSKKIVKVYFENDKNYYDTYVYIKDNITFSALPSITYLDAINSMLNNRYPDHDHKSSNNSYRKIMIRVYKNKNIVVLGNWTKENGIEFINKKKIK
jgi:hypothetical protein